MAHAGRRRFWFDPRFAIGVALIVAAVAGVTVLVTALDRTVAVVAARQTVVPGDRIDADDVVVRRVSVDGAESLYLTPGELADGVVVTRTVGTGELLPRAAVGDPAGVDTTTIVVPLAGELAAAVQPGAVVDVWSDGSGTASVPPASGEADAAALPAIVAPNVAVARIVDEPVLVAGSATTSVEVLVPRDVVPALIAAMSGGGALRVVPAALPVAAASGGK
ncbi:hypothetical protein QT381_06720 [Galbitalea sp. SE-J8]|uniref:SAF domain-containing protein n=1 Tax=Galbitalea sp. SE-J8 TaxID=3054952 RepID=UPI00259C77DD|nr:SAF domain-containing protein [Galbitalea sp. SE-J8]MDM4762696.1 hypothetical protein [Galbitalea sp. SE-J8]